SMPNSPRRGEDDQPRGTPRELLRTPHPPVAGGLPALLRLTTQQVIARLEHLRILLVEAPPVVERPRELVHALRLDLPKSEYVRPRNRHRHRDFLLAEDLCPDVLALRRQQEAPLHEHHVHPAARLREVLRDRDCASRRDVA